MSQSKQNQQKAETRFQIQILKGKNLLIKFNLREIELTEQ